MEQQKPEGPAVSRKRPAGPFGRVCGAVALSGVKGAVRGPQEVVDVIGVVVRKKEEEKKKSDPQITQIDADRIVEQKKEPESHAQLHEAGDVRAERSDSAWIKPGIYRHDDDG